LSRGCISYKKQAWKDITKILGCTRLVEDYPVPNTRSFVKSVSHLHVCNWLTAYQVTNPPFRQKGHTALHISPLMFRGDGDKEQGEKRF